MIEVVRIKIMTLPHHVRKWWDIANDRRQRLIVKNSKAVFGKGPDLTKAQAAEMKVLQTIADLIITMYAPPPRVLDIIAKERKLEGWYMALEVEEAFSRKTFQEPGETLPQAIARHLQLALEKGYSMGKGSSERGGGI